MSIYLTGDTHGDFFFDGYQPKVPLQRVAYCKEHLTKEDVLIILGDFGYLFYPDLDTISTSPYLSVSRMIDLLHEVRKGREEEAEKLRCLQDGVNGAIILFVGGNHENWDRLDNLPVQQLYGSTVGIVGEGIYHLKNGNVYEIGGKRFLAFGGASSTDKDLRIPAISWWAREVPSQEELDNALHNMRDQQVDVILSHTCPKAIKKKIKSQWIDRRFHDPTEDMLQTLIEQVKNARYHWYFGHFHENQELGACFTLL